MVTVTLTQKTGKDTRKSTHKRTMSSLNKVFGYTYSLLELTPVFLTVDVLSSRGLGSSVQFRMGPTDGSRNTFVSSSTLCSRKDRIKDLLKKWHKSLTRVRCS